MADFDRFKNCMLIQEKLDLEAFDLILFDPLARMHAWWTRQTPATQAYTSFIVSAGATALAFWIGKAIGIAGTKVAALLATALIVLLGTVALSALMASVGRCLAQQT